jgi:AAA family ATP:ADP antiporter
MLRPVRETMGVAGGVDNLQWLFTGTFIATLACLPLFGWLASKVQRRHILPWTYGFFASNLLLFAVLFAGDPDDLWNARAFYIWLSVFNLLSISLAWSVLTDLFSTEQGKRLFGLLAAGASLGGLSGPIWARCWWRRWGMPGWCCWPRHCWWAASSRPGCNAGAIATIADE